MPGPYDSLRQPKGPLAMSLEQRAQKLYGMDPEVQRLNILPYPQGALSGQEGEVDWTNWVAPELFYDMAKSSLLPGHVAQGGDWQESDVTQMYLDSMLGAGPAGAMTAGGKGGVLAGSLAKGGNVIESKLQTKLEQKGRHRVDIERPVHTIKHAKWNQSKGEWDPAVTEEFVRFVGEPVMGGKATQIWGILADGSRVEQSLLGAPYDKGGESFVRALNSGFSDVPITKAPIESLPPDPGGGFFSLLNYLTSKDKDIDLTSGGKGGAKAAAGTKLADTLTQDLEGAPAGNLPAVTGPIQKNLLDKPVSRRGFLEGAKKAGEMVTAVTNPMVQGLMKVLPETAAVAKQTFDLLPDAEYVYDLPAFQYLQEGSRIQRLLDDAANLTPEEQLDAFGVEDISVLSDKEVLDLSMESGTQDAIDLITQDPEELLAYFQGDIELDEMATGYANRSEAQVVIQEIIDLHGKDREGVKQVFLNSEILIEGKGGHLMVEGDLDPAKLTKAQRKSYGFSAGGKGGVVVGAASALAPTYQGRLAAALEAMPQEKWTKPQALGYLQKKGGYSKDEFEHTGLQKMLLGDGNVTKTEMLDQVKSNPLELVDVKKGVLEETANPQTYEAVEMDDVGRAAGGWDVVNTATGQRFHDTLSGGEPILQHEAQMFANEGTAAGYIEGDTAMNRAPQFGSGGKAQWASFMHPGGEDYRNLLITLPRGPQTKEVVDARARIRELMKKDPEGYGRELNADEVAEMKRMRDIVDKDRSDFEFDDQHWMEGKRHKNVLAGVLYDTREIDGEKALMMLEGQSEWHQRGAKEGYYEGPPEGAKPLKHSDLDMSDMRREVLPLMERIDHDFDNSSEALINIMDQDALHRESDHTQARPTYVDWHDMWGHERLSMDEVDRIDEYLEAAYDLSVYTEGSASLVPDAPYKKNWPDLVMRRMIREAAETDHGRVAWFGGEAVHEKEPGGSLKFFQDLYDKRFKQAAKKYGADVEEVDVPISKSKAVSELRQVSDGDVYGETGRRVTDWNPDLDTPDGWYFLPQSADWGGVERTIGTVGPFETYEEALRFNNLSLPATRKGYSFKVTPEMQTKIMTEGVLLSGGKGGAMAASLMQGMRPLGGSQDDLRKQIRKRARQPKMPYRPPPLRLKEVLQGGI